MKPLIYVAIALSASFACGKKDSKKAKPAAEPAAASKTDASPAAKPEIPTISTTEVRYRVGETEFRGYIALPPGDGKHPGVLVVHEWWGHNDYARKRARMLAEMGYAALAVDMFGDGKQASHPKDAMAFAGEALKDKAVTEARFTAALEILKKHPRVEAEKLGAIGYCFGGGVVLEMAKRGVDLDLFASFHGSLGTETVFSSGSVKGPVFVAHGAADSFVKTETIATFQKQMKDAGVDLRFTAYEGAKHSFTNPGADANAKKFSIDLGYNKAADAQSWATLTEMLATELK